MDLVLADVRLATMEAGGEPHGEASASAIGFENGRIAWIGRVDAYVGFVCDVMSDRKSVV